MAGSKFCSSTGTIGPKQKVHQHDWRRDDTSIHTSPIHPEIANWQRDGENIPCTMATPDDKIPKNQLNEKCPDLMEEHNKTLLKDIKKT